MWITRSECTLTRYVVRVLYVRFFSSRAGISTSNTSKEKQSCLILPGISVMLEAEVTSSKQNGDFKKEA